MLPRQPFPNLWLVTDERNDSVLDAALRRLPRGSGLIYRHYHLPDGERIARFHQLARIARAREMVVILADSALTAAEWGADGIYGSPRALYPQRDMLRLATAHDLREIGDANRLGADAVLLSPAFATRSHPDAQGLGPARFRLLAAHSRIPVIALGGMDRRGAARLDWPYWAAIDGLS